ncbi:MAG: N-acetylmuramoyl-L-alanine amidase [Methylococcaceae bacterium]|nr:N-acetylmuramoyl-L-alanine amidase [Methylococcaceae bacterium]
MRHYWKVVVFLGLQLASVIGHAQQVDVSALRYWNTPDQTRMTFDVTNSPEHRVFLMNNPPRLVIDMRNTKAKTKQAFPQPAADHPLFSKLRFATKDGSDLRVVIDLKRPLNAKTATLRTNSLNGNLLVIELLSKTTTANSNTETKVAANKPENLIPAVNILSKSPKTEAPQTANIKKASRPLKPIATVAQKSKGIVVAIDAGHGGKDVGALGASGTQEKHVTLSIAKKLAALINSQPGMKAVLTRKNDYYVGLRKRMQIARAGKADLFVSIHADAYPNETVKGASVFTLSSKGATNEAARWLADSENASDLVGGVSLGDKDEILASVLLDLSQTATQEASDNVASNVLKNFEDIGELHHGSVQKANFMVLKSPDIPSILVETAFISNPSEDLKLVNTAHQTKIATAIFNGLRNYFDKTAPIESRVAALDL